MAANHLVALLIAGQNIRATTLPDETKAGLAMLQNLMDNDAAALAQMQRWTQQLLCNTTVTTSLGENFQCLPVFQKIENLNNLCSNGLNLTADMGQALRAVHLLTVIYANPQNQARTPDAVLQERPKPARRGTQGGQVATRPGISPERHARC